MDNSYKAIKVDTTTTSVEELWEIAADKLMLTSERYFLSKYFLTIMSAPLFFIWGVRNDLGKNSTLFYSYLLKRTSFIHSPKNIRCFW